MHDDERQQLDSALTRLAAGDRSAFQQAFELVSPVLTHFVRRAMAGSPECEDASQNTLLRIFGRVSDYRPGTDALAWVLTLAAFEIATLRKRSHRQKARYGGSADALATITAPDDIEGSTLERESLQKLNVAVGQLAPLDQHILLAAEAGPKAPRERKQKQRAMERLRQLWRALNGDD